VARLPSDQFRRFMRRARKRQHGEGMFCQRAQPVVLVPARKTEICQQAQGTQSESCKLQAETHRCCIGRSRSWQAPCRKPGTCFRSSRMADCWITDDPDEHK
jgi:hypothetical protein